MGVASDTIVFFHGALGDCVLLWPLLRALAPLTLVGPAGAGRLAERELLGVKAIEDGTAEWSRLFADDAGAARGAHAPAVLESARLVISFVSDGADAWARNVRGLRPECRCLFARSRPPAGAKVHVTTYRRRQLEHAGLQLAAAAPGLCRPRSTRTAPREGRRTTVVLAPGSGAPAKCWPADRFERLALRLLDRGLDVRIVMGHVERERFDAGLLDRWHARFDVGYPPTPIELADHIRDASLFAGNDSGPTHLAAQLGVPTLALFGPTDPRVWSPVGPDVTLVAPPSPRPMDWLALEQVERIACARLSTRSRSDQA